MIEVCAGPQLNAMTAERLAAEIRSHVPALLDLRSVRFCTTPALGLLLSLFASTQQRGALHKLSIAMPESTSVTRFLHKMQWFAFLDRANMNVFVNQEILTARDHDVRNSNALVARDDVHPYMPFYYVSRPASEQDRREFDAACGAFLSRLAETFEGVLRGTYGFAIADIQNVLHATREIVDNAYTHSGAACFAAVQATARGLYAYFSDAGVGIRSALDPVRLSRGISPNAWTDALAIHTAFEFGTTGTMTGRGTGLWDLKRYAASMNGVIEFRSGSTRCIVRNERVRVLTTSAVTIAGVQISLFLPSAERSTRRGAI